MSSAASQAAAASVAAAQAAAGIHYAPVTVNSTVEKAAQIHALIANVTKSTVTETVAQLTKGIAGPTLPEGHKVSRSLSANALTAATSTFTPFHSVRYAVAASMMSVVGAERGPNYDERIAVTRGVIAFAVCEPGAIGLLSDAFSELSSTKTKGFSPTAGSILEVLTSQLKVPESHRWVIAIAMCYSVQESTRTDGRKLLERLCATGNPACERLRGCGVSDEHLNSLRQLFLCDGTIGPLPKDSTAAPTGLAALRADLCGPAAPLRVIAAPPQRDTLAGLQNSFSLAGLIEELGPSCVATQADCAELLELVPTLAPRIIAECLALLSTSAFSASTKDSNAYNSLRVSLRLPENKNSSATAAANNATTPIHHFVTAVRERNPQLNWMSVLEALDSPTVRLERFSGIAAAYTKACPDANLPCEPFLKRWRNTRVQALALKYIMEHSDLVDFPVSKEHFAALGRRQHHYHTNKNFKMVPVAIAATAATTCPGWRCVEFAEAVSYVCSRDTELDTLVTTAAKEAPALVFASLCAARSQGSLQHLVLASHVLKLCGPAVAITDGVASFLVGEGLASLLIGLVSDLVTHDGNYFIEAVETLTHMQLVNAVLSSNTNTRLVVGCAIAGRETKQTPDRWVEQHLAEAKEQAPVSMAVAGSDGLNRVGVAIALLEVAEEFMSKQKFIGSTTLALKTLHTSTIAHILPNVVAHAKVLLESGECSFPADVETEANTLFKNFIEPSSKVVPIDECLKLAKSSTPRDRQLFACIVHILFEECKAIGSYPWSSLTAAARLFGQLIEHDLLSMQRVHSALHFVHSVISKNDQRASEFGIMALECFYNRLPDWPQYCRQLRALENIYLDQRIPGIMAIVTRALKTAKRKHEDPNAAADGTDGPAQTASGTGQSAANDKIKEEVALGFHTHDISVITTTDQSFLIPPQIVQDQINFVVGNTDPSKLQSNAAELSRLVAPEYFPYFSDYFVVRRVSLEPNYHGMYLELIAAMDLPGLDAAMRTASVNAVRKILRSHNVRTDANERMLLKNLGSWYGQITLTRNIPVLARDVDFKAMLIAALKEGKLIAVVPFIAKVLEHCAGPRCVFRPPNPWTMSQLSHLLEMYHLRDLKITLRFEVEVLLKNIGVKVDDIEEFVHVTRRGTIPGQETMFDIREHMDVSQSNDFRVDDSGNSNVAVLGNASMFAPQPGPMLGAMSSMGMHGLHRNSTPPPRMGTRLAADAAPFQPQRPIEPIPPYPGLVLSDQCVVITTDGRYVSAEKMPSYRTAIVKIMEAALEQVSNNIDRAATIAVSSASAFVVNDFMHDGDVSSMLRAATIMTRSLAANLSCNIREALRMRFEHCVQCLAKTLLRDGQPNELANLQHTVSTNNFDSVVRALETRVVERATARVREALEARVNSRRGELKPEEAAVAHNLPETLRTMGRLTQDQRAAYEDYLNLTPVHEKFNFRLRHLEELTAKFLEKNADAASNPWPTSDPAFLQQALPPNTMQFVVDLRDRFADIAVFITPDTGKVVLPIAMARFLALADRLQGDGPALRVAEVLRDVLVTVLDQIKQRFLNSEPVSEAYIADPARFRSANLTAALMRRQLVNLAHLDRSLAGDIRDRRAVDFASELLNCVILREKITTVRHLNDTLKALNSFAQSRNAGAVPPPQASPPAQQPPQPQHPQQSAPNSIAPASTLPAQQQAQQVPSNAAAPAFAAPAVQPSQPRIAALEYAPSVKRVRVHSYYAGDDARSVLRPRIAKYLDDWLAICANKRPASGAAGAAAGTDNDYRTRSMEFMAALQGANMLKTMEGGHLDCLIGTMLELGVEHFCTVRLEEERAAATAPAGSPTSPAAPHLFNVNTARGATTAEDRQYAKIDGFSDLLQVLLRCCNGSGDNEQTPAEVNLISKVLIVAFRVLSHNHDITAKLVTAAAANMDAPDGGVAAVQQLAATAGRGRVALEADEGHQLCFVQNPYVRFLSNLLVLNARLLPADAKPHMVVTADETVRLLLEALQGHPPSRLPQFACGWLELVSHRTLFARVLRPDTTVRPAPARPLQPLRHRKPFAALVGTALKFLDPLTKGEGISRSALIFAKGVLKLLLVLLHDQPDFVLHAVYQLADYIPTACVQMRNIVLCAFPSNRLPDPFGGLPAEPTAEMLAPPEVPDYVAETLEPVLPNEQLLRMVASGGADGTVDGIVDRFSAPVAGGGNARRWSIPHLNAFVVLAAHRYLEGRAHQVPAGLSPATDPFAQLIVRVADALDNEGRYHLVNALVNQLRYPNSHTHLVIRLVLGLFAAGRALPAGAPNIAPRLGFAQTADRLREQITRVLAERLLAARPHPWGPLVTFIELLRTDGIAFWENSFVRCTPDVEAALQKLARTLIPVAAPAQAQPQPAQ